MSRRSPKIAESHARLLPSFASQAEAERALFALRDERLARFTAWAADSGSFEANGMPESLKGAEAWYFETVAQSVARIGVNKGDLDAALGAYFGRVFVENAGFEWIVSESPFAPGHFGIGVRKGLGSLMLTNGVSPEPPERNRRKQSLFRQFQRYSSFGKTP